MPASCCATPGPVPTAGPGHPGPKPRRTLIESIVHTIWLAAEQPCGQRLARALPLWLPHYERRHGKERVEEGLRTGAHGVCAPAGRTPPRGGVTAKPHCTPNTEV